MKHHPSCQEDHEEIEELLERVHPTAHVAAVYAQLSIANRLAGIEELLAARFTEDSPAFGRVSAAARAVEDEVYGGSSE